MAHLALHRDGAILHIGDMLPPGKGLSKRPVIAIEHGCQIRVLGWLRDESAVQEILDKFGPAQSGALNP